MGKTHAARGIKAFATKYFHFKLGALLIASFGSEALCFSAMLLLRAFCSCVVMANISLYLPEKSSPVPQPAWGGQVPSEISHTSFRSFQGLSDPEHILA